MSEKCIIYISSTNYNLVSAGTEKFMKGVMDLFEKEKVHSLHFFPLSNINNKLQKLGIEKNYIGINCDGAFIGIYLLDDMVAAVKFVADKYNFEFDRIIVNQLHLWNLSKLTKMFELLELPIFLVVHDYMMICPYMMEKDSNTLECGRNIDKPSAHRCGKCKYATVEKVHFKNFVSFLEDNRERICRVVFPSDSSKQNWINVFPYLSESSIIRSHLKYNILKEDRSLNKKIRIGYLGHISDIKGYSEWLKLMRCLDDKNFEFYYFGGDVKQAERDGAKGIYVNFNLKKLPSMVEQLKFNNIDIAFLWSNCQETYSYTYYEAFEAGCWIVTSFHSGNITDQVLKNKNGKVFKNVDECIDYLNGLKGNISTARIVNVKNNSSLTEFMPQQNVVFNNINKIESKRPDFVMSYLYSNLRGIK